MVEKLVTFIVVASVGLAVLATAGPSVVCLVKTLIPLVLVVGIVVGMLRVIWYVTRSRW